MSAGYHATDRAVLRVSGPETRDFLQGLVTNDVGRLDHGPVYAALLSPQGKYLFDFFLVPSGEDVLIDVKADRAAALAQRLGLYRLRAKVSVDPTDLAMILGLGAAPPGALADPRDPGLGWRALADDPAAFLAGIEPLAPEAIAAQRIALGVPESGVELLPDDSYILEMGFERLHGVDFRKGCYVGQEVTARMKHKTELRKGLARVRVEGAAPPPGTEIRAGDKVAGTLYSVADGIGLAYLRFDRAGGDLVAGSARITEARQ
jgi:folate-binding protein YgfZ